MDTPHTHPTQSDPETPYQQLRSWWGARRSEDGLRSSMETAVGGGLAAGFGLATVAALFTPFAPAAIALGAVALWSASSPRRAGTHALAAARRLSTPTTASRVPERP